MTYATSLCCHANVAWKDRGLKHGFSSSLLPRCARSCDMQKLPSQITWHTPWIITMPTRLSFHVHFIEAGWITWHAETPFTPFCLVTAGSHDIHSYSSFVTSQKQSTALSLLPSRNSPLLYPLSQLALSKFTVTVCVYILQCCQSVKSHLLGCVYMWVFVYKYLRNNIFVYKTYKLDFLSIHYHILPCRPFPVTWCIDLRPTHAYRLATVHGPCQCLLHRLNNYQVLGWLHMQLEDSCISLLHWCVVSILCLVHK